MSVTSITELERELEKVRTKLHALVNGDINLLLDEKVYSISAELDKLIVKLMKNEVNC